MFIASLLSVQMNVLLATEDKHLPTCLPVHVIFIALLVVYRWCCHAR